MADAHIDVYTTCPPTPDTVVDVARWTEDHGGRGALVYTDNSLLDPWTVAQATLVATTTFVPLIAVQPIYQHPFAVANQIASLAALYERSVDINFVSGGFQGHLSALGDTLDHDQRYARLQEFADIVDKLLTQSTITHTGRYYQLTRARTQFRVAAHRRPRCYVSGSSPASAAAADALGLVQLSYPTPPEDFVARPADRRGHHGNGIRLGIIARDTAEAAWRDAEQRFPDDDIGRRMHELAAATVTSTWHQDLSTQARRHPVGADNYWLRPFHTYKTFCPYLVGSHEEVGAMLRSYLDDGVRTVILDVPASSDDLGEAMLAIRKAVAMSNITTRECRDSMPDDRIAALSALWTDVLLIDDITSDDNFFELGGNSFLALVILDRVRKEHGLTVELDDFFAEPTIDGIVRHATTAVGSGG